ncbi:hypothetical protein lerEdw1_009143 [Lerista edwardsae]|nr:hypothetical protein lerEdw1_009143 [Lerista edwardsae]
MGGEARRGAHPAQKSESGPFSALRAGQPLERTLRAGLPAWLQRGGGMIRRGDTQRAVEILARYQGVLHSPEEQPLQASIGKVVHVFQSELFQALLDIQECYELSLLAACQQDGSSERELGAPCSLHGAAPQRFPQGHSRGRCALQGKPEGRAAWGQDSGPAPRLVRVTESSTELPARVCSLVVGVCSTLPQGTQDPAAAEQTHSGNLVRQASFCTLTSPRGGICGVCEAIVACSKVEWE